MHQGRYPNTVIFELLLGAAFNYFVAMLPVWELAKGANVVARAFDMVHVIIYDSSAYSGTFVQIFWFPLLAGVIFSFSVLIAIFSAPSRVGRVVAIFLPILVTGTIFLYVLIARLDISFLGLSMVPGVVAWWTCRKECVTGKFEAQKLGEKTRSEPDGSPQS